MVGTPILGGLSTILYYLHASISSYIKGIYLKIKTEQRIRESHMGERGRNI